MSKESLARYGRTWWVNTSDGTLDLVVTDHVPWRLLLLHRVDFGLASLGHPCCYMGIGRIPAVGNFCHRLLLWAYSVDERAMHNVTAIPLSVEQARALDASRVNEFFGVDD